MEFLNKLMGRINTPAPAARTHIAAIVRDLVNQPALDAASKRMGMWARVPEGIGIITGCRIDGLAEVTLAKADGSTLMALGANDKAVPLVVVTELATLRQAYIHEIPETRRGDVERLRSMGYTNGGA
jgi:hypothetical protein